MRIAITACMAIPSGQAQTSDTPGIIVPEAADGWQPAVSALCANLALTSGAIGAWLDPRVLADRIPGTPPVANQPTTLLAVVVCEPGQERSEAVIANGREIVITAIDAGFVEDALEWDDELAQIIARGYRLCGGDREVFAIESLAKEIVSTAPGGERP